MDNSVFDGLHGSGMFIGPEKGCSFVCEVYNDKLPSMDGG
jgi:hypothetical protein